VFQFVGVREMRHQRDVADARNGAQAGMRRAESLGP
jgi:hypothetical protein